MVTASAPAVLRQAKGINLVGLAKMLRGKELVKTVPGLTPEDRALLSGLIMPGAWYPFETWVRVLLAAHQALGGGLDEAARVMGRAHAESMLNGPHATYLTRGDVLKTMQAAPRMWANYFNFGTVVVESPTATSVRLNILGYPDMSRCHGMLLTQGWWAHVAELAGAQNVIVKFERAPWLGNDGLRAVISWT